jgi:hypothetical protein
VPDSSLTPNNSLTPQVGVQTGGKGKKIPGKYIKMNGGKRGRGKSRGGRGRK